MSSCASSLDDVLLFEDKINGIPVPTKSLSLNAVTVCKELEINGLTVIFTRHHKDYMKVIDEQVRNMGGLYNINIIEKPTEMHRITNDEKDQILNKINNIMSTLNDYTKMNLPVVVILTAIQEEYIGVKQYLDEIIEDNKYGTHYEIGLFAVDNNRVAKVIIRECGAGNTNAAQETERAIQYYNPNMILFVGIAGSRKIKDFNIGDVICPNKIYSYEAGRAENNSFMARPELVQMSYVFREMAKSERRKEDWKSFIKTPIEYNIKADIGIVASGEQLIEHYNSDVGQILTKYYNDTQAVEMEGFGFAKAAINQGYEKSAMMIGIIRGISDIINSGYDTNGNDNVDNRPHNQKVIASNTAAAFAYWLVYKICEENQLIIK